MNTQFKRHESVKILVDPDPEYIEYHNPEDESEITKVPIVKGMQGKINMLLPNGQYHVQIEVDGKVIAYCTISEENLESI